MDNKYLNLLTIFNKLDSQTYEWSDELWLLMVKNVIVYEDKFKFIFNGGNEIEI